MVPLPELEAIIATMFRRTFEAITLYELANREGWHFSDYTVEGEYVVVTFKSYFGAEERVYREKMIFEDVEPVEGRIAPVLT